MTGSHLVWIAIRHVLQDGTYHQLLTDRTRKTAMGEGYFMEYLLAIGLVFLGLLLVCVPRPRKRSMLTPEEEAKLNKKRKRQKAFAAKKAKASKK